MVVGISFEASTSIVGKTACVPCTDMGDVNGVSMRLMFHHLLYPILAPHRNLLSFRLSPTHVQFLKDDYFGGPQYGIVNDGIGNLLCKFIVNTLCVLPETSYIVASMFTLVSLNAVQYRVEMVFVTGEVYKLPVQDSAIRLHDTANRIGVDTKVYRTNKVRPIRDVVEFFALFKGETKVISAVPFLKGRGGSLDMAPMLLKVYKVCMSDIDSVPQPFFAVVQLQPYSISVSGFIHTLVIEGWHPAAIRLQPRRLPLLAGYLPILIVGTVAGDGSKSLLYHGSAEVAWHLRKAFIELSALRILVALRRMEQLFCIVEPFLGPLDSLDAAPMQVDMFDAEGKSLPTVFDGRVHAFLDT